MWYLLICLGTFVVASLLASWSTFRLFFRASKLTDPCHQCWAGMRPAICGPLVIEVLTWLSCIHLPSYLILGSFIYCWTELRIMDWILEVGRHQVYKDVYLGATWHSEYTKSAQHFGAHRFPAISQHSKIDDYWFGSRYSPQFYKWRSDDARVKFHTVPPSTKQRSVQW